MLPAKEHFTNIYNPLNLDKKTLLDNFVVRITEFNKVFRVLKRSRLNQSSQNFIIQGQRGAGKTTLLAKIRYEIEDNSELSHLLPVQFAEEQYNIFSLNRLWLTLADYLEERKGFESLVHEMEEYEEHEDLFFLIETALKKNKKKLVLLIDNFGNILDKLKENEHKKLRDILHESDLQIIAASTKTLETTYKHDKPFFESFKTITLKPLSEEKVLELLKSLSKRSGNPENIELIRSQKDKIEAIRRLSGGMPRTILFLYEIILDSTGSIFDYLEGILDKITPLYQHRMESLSKYQQAIMDALALNWDGMLASEISKKINMETKAVSSQLKTLEKNQIVTSDHLNKKEKIYFIEERFFNIWYLMRYGRKKSINRVKWLVSFLNNWCTSHELLEKAKIHIELAKTDKLNQKGGYIMAEALYQTIGNPQLKREILISTKNCLKLEYSHLEKQIPELDEDIFEKGVKCSEESYIKEAETVFLELSENGNIPSLFSLALFHHKIEEFKKAEKFYLIAAQHKIPEAMNNLATIYHNEFKDFKNAEKFYLMAVQHKFTIAMFNLAFFYKNKLNNPENAEKYYNLAKDTEFNNEVNFLYTKNLIFTDAAVSLFKGFHNDSDLKSSLILAFIILHNGNYKESAMFFKGFLDHINHYESHQNLIIKYLIILIAKKQYHLTYEILNEKNYNLKEIIKPLYYALMELLGDEYPKELKRMGSELSQTVEEIIQEIKRLEN